MLIGSDDETHERQTMHLGRLADVCSGLQQDLDPSLSDPPSSGSHAVRLRLGYTRSVSEVPLRDLRNNTARVLRRAQAGEQIVITTRGKPVASLSPVAQPRRRWLPRTELVRRLKVAQADVGLRDDLNRLAGETTEDLGPIA